MLSNTCMLTPLAGGKKNVSLPFDSSCSEILGGNFVFVI